ncbi:Uncharacterised protein [Bordetella pseudohinzii]|uniref:Uncharacterized protein n=1 Tax=Bordetella pseudohinzii TaxID=1331258 RepID=A0A0M7GUE4_9BORD|nr:Uncharacterised protein [Bordetella pseudohinzii]
MRHLVKGARHAVQVERAAIDPQMHLGLDVDVRGIAEGRNKGHAQRDLVDDLLAPRDLVVQPYAAAFEAHIVQREAGQALLGLRVGRRLGGLLGKLLLDIRKIKARDVLAHQVDLGFDHAHRIDHGGEQDEGAPGRAGLQQPDLQQRRLGLRLGDRQIMRPQREGEGIEGDVAHADIPAQQRGHVPGQGAAHHLGHLPGRQTGQQEHDQHDRSQDLHAAARKFQCRHAKGHLDHS